MPDSVSGGAMSGGDAVARMTDYYSATAIDIPSESSELDEPAGETTRQARDTNGVVSQPAGVIEAPAETTPTDSGTPATVASESAAKPYRIFASETEYRDHLRDETTRQRAAQSASDLALKATQLEVERLKADIQTHERTRNELYARAAKEQIEPETVVEVFTRREGETRAELAERQRAAEVAANAEASRGETESLSAKASKEAATSLLLRKSLELTRELGVIEGLDVEKALGKAIVESPEAQRYVALSYNAPEATDREWAQQKAYEIGMGVLREQAATIKLVTAQRAAPPEPAVSIQAPATVGTEVRRYASAVDALSAAYGGTR